MERGTESLVQRIPDFGLVRDQECRADGESNRCSGQLELVFTNSLPESVHARLRATDEILESLLFFALVQSLDDAALESRSGKMPALGILLETLENTCFQQGRNPLTILSAR